MAWEMISATLKDREGGGVDLRVRRGSERSRAGESGGEVKADTGWPPFSEPVSHDLETPVSWQILSNQELGIFFFFLTLLTPAGVMERN
jgi:hypothetical protein